MTGKTWRWAALAAFAALGSTIWPLGPAQSKTTNLAPFTRWNVDYGEKICTLRRGFGSKEEPTVLIMDRFGPTDTFQLAIVSNQFKFFEQGEALNLQFGEQKPRRLNNVIPGKAGAKTATLFFGNISLAEAIGDKRQDKWLPPVTPAMEAATKSITIAYGSSKRVLQTGPLNKAFDTLRQCTDNLVRTWGLDPRQQATLSRRLIPKTKQKVWLSSSDYPAAMLIRGKQAQVNFRLSVNAQGIPTACEVQSSYNDKAFDDVTCATLMRRVRFEPALDSKGLPVPSYYFDTVRWVMAT